MIDPSVSPTARAIASAFGPVIREAALSLGLGA